jgi:hypothetical protein
MSVAAIIAAPMVTLYVQRKLEDKKARDKRRQQIFNALWINRRRPFWVARIDALNMIDVEFFGEQEVQDAWQDLFAHYSRQHPGLNDDQIAQEREEKFATLLYAMSKVLGYKFSRTDIRDNIYRPQLHGTVEEIEIETRARILNLLRSDALPVRFVQGEVNQSQAQPNLRRLLDEIRGGPPVETDRN